MKRGKQKIILLKAGMAMIIALSLIISGQAVASNSVVLNILDDFEKTETSTIIYVDDDFDSSTPGWQVTHFDNIQDGIDAADAGGTVNVFSGLYFENIVISKTLNLLSITGEEPVIDGSDSGDVVQINADSVTISGFTIQNSGGWGRGIFTDGNYTNITDVILTGTHDKDIWVSEASYTCITASTIMNADYAGIILRGTAHTSIFDNIFLYNGAAINLRDTSDTMISGNTIAEGGWGLNLWPSSNNTQIIGNIIHDNEDYPIQIFGSSSIGIIGNKVYDNGAEIYVDGPADVVTINNNIVTNNLGGITLGSYITNCTVSDNIIENNEWSGLNLFYLSDSTITNNTFSGQGIMIWGFCLEEFNTHTIENNQVNGKPIRYYKNSNGGTVPADTGQVILANCSNFTIKDLIMDNINTGIQLAYCTQSSIENNQITTIEESFLGGILVQNSTSISISYNQIVNSGMSIASSQECTILGNTLNLVNGYGGMFLWLSSYNEVVQNIITNNPSDGYGIGLQQSSHNLIKGNMMDHLLEGVILYDGCTYNVFTDNEIRDSGLGFDIITPQRGSDVPFGASTIGGSENKRDGPTPVPCVDNTIYHNNFINNTQQAFDEFNNNWDNGYPSGGNYWDDHPNPLDDYSGSGQNESGSDGIIDTPYDIPGGSTQDRYPFIEPIENNLFVEIGGPYNVNIGEYVNFYENVRITGGAPPYSLMWHWGDGSGGTAGIHAFGGNEPAVYNVALTVRDSESPISSIGVGTTRVYTQLPTDNNIFVEKYVKQQNSMPWKKQVKAQVGDILNVKIVIETVGSSLLNLSVSDEHTGEFEYINDSINIEPWFFHPGGAFGPAFAWNFTYVEPGTVIEITYDVQVISEYISPAILDGLAVNGVECFAYLAERSRIGPGGFIASDMDFVTVSIKKDYGTIITVDDNGGADYTRIQDAIDAASDGDIIRVRPGIYVEHLEITKSITLKGYNSQRTIIDGDVNITQHSSTIEIRADGVTIRGFTIRNAMKSGIYVESDRNLITQNRIIDNGLQGIYLHTGDSNRITKNKILRNGEGIFIFSNYNLIKENTIKSNMLGISIDYMNVANDIYQNNLINNDIQAWDCNFHGNHWHGYSLTEKREVGNYWSDYTGEDTDGDGIGDTPYTIISPCGYGGILVDLYPLMKKTNINIDLQPVELDQPQMIEIP